jgi:transcriptional regulator with XRE-family HTH domain
MENLVSDIFRQWIRAGLKQSGKTQMGLAQHLGIAHPQITHLLNGNRRLNVDEVPRIAEYLEIDPPAFPPVTGRPVGRQAAEGRLRSAMLAFGVDKDDLSRAVSAVKVFVDDLDEPQSQDPLDDQSRSSSRHRGRVP